MVKICDKYGSRLNQKEAVDLWLFSIKGLFGIKTEVYKILDEAESEDSSDDGQEISEERANFEKFLLIRNQFFMQRMSEHVNLRRII